MISDLVKRLWEMTGVYNYDPADSEVYIAGKFLKDLTNLNVNRSSPNKTEDGIDKSYHTYSKAVSRPVLSISVLPYGEDFYFLWKLHNYISMNGGSFEVDVKNNGTWIGKFVCYFSELPDENISRDAPDAVFILRGVEKSLGAFEI